MITLSQKYKFFFTIIFILLTGCIGISIIFNAWKIDTIKVVLKKGAKEHYDKAFMKIGKNEKPPDYNLKIRTGKKWIDCGTYSNTYIKTGLEYKIHSSAPVFLVKEIKLIEKDKINSDLLEQMPLTSDHLVGNNYEFYIHKSFDFESGMSWFFNTTLGKIIGGAIFVSLSIGIIGAMS